MTQILLYMIGVIMLVCGIITITRRNPMHSALWLVATFVAMAMFFVLLNAEFVAAVELMVYAGGIMVLYMFVVMMVNLSKTELRKRVFHNQIIAALTLCLCFLTVTIILVGPSIDRLVKTSADKDLSIETLANTLMTHYLLPFEIVSILLLAALVGAVLLSVTKSPNTLEVPEER